jgi:hypothetical protein
MSQWLSLKGMRSSPKHWYKITTIYNIIYFNNGSSRGEEWNDEEA